MTLLRVSDLVVEYPGRGFRDAGYRALDGISLDIEAGECFGLVGESGSGKSTLGKTVLGLVLPSEGSIEFEGRDITRLRSRERRGMTKNLQVIFQDPYSSLSPRMSVGALLAEPLRAQGVSRSEAAEQIDHLIRQVGLPADSIHRLPREFSGGQRQRIAIARALALSPRLIVCDEPVSALDLTTQARILDLLLEIQAATNVAYLFISHDLAVVRHMSHRIAVLRDGHIVERGDCATVTSHPTHPYTRQLMLAAPVADPVVQAERRLLRTSSAHVDENRIQSRVPRSVQFSPNQISMHVSRTPGNQIRNGTHADN